MAITDVSPLNEVDFISFCIDPGQQSDDRPCCGSLFLAPMLTGDAVPGQVYPVATYAQALELFGEGSIAADMTQYYDFNNRFGELYVAGLTDLGTKATKGVGFQGPATRNGTIKIMVAGVVYSIAVAKGDTGIEIAAELVDLINNDTNAVVTATSAGSVTTIEAKNGGEQGNYINVFDVSDGVNTGVDTTVFLGPPGSPASMNGGAGTYDLTTILEEYCDCCYEFIGVPFSDPKTLNDLETFSQRRHTCDKLIGGRFYTTRYDTFTDHIVAHDADQYLYGTIWDECTDEESTPWAQTAAAIGQAHASTCSDPANDWRFRTLIGISCNNGLCGVGCFNKDERNLLVANGGSTTRCNGSTKELEVTVGAGQYSFDSYFKYPQTDYTTFRFIREFNDFLFENFSNAKIVDNIANTSTGSNSVDVAIILSSIITWIEDTQGEIISNIDDIRSSIEIERDPTNPSRINIRICASIVTAIRKFAIQVQPKLGQIN